MKRLFIAVVLAALAVSTFGSPCAEEGCNVLEAGKSGNLRSSDGGSNHRSLQFEMITNALAGKANTVTSLMDPLRIFPRVANSSGQIVPSLITPPTLPSFNVSSIFGNSSNPLTALFQPKLDLVQGVQDTVQEKLTTTTTSTTTTTTTTTTKPTPFSLGVMLKVTDNKKDDISGQVTGWTIVVATNGNDPNGPEYTFKSTTTPFDLVDGGSVVNDDMNIVVPGLQKPADWVNSIISVTTTIEVSGAPMDQLTAEIFTDVATDDSYALWKGWTEFPSGATFQGPVSFDDEAWALAGTVGNILTAVSFKPSDIATSKFTDYMKQKLTTKTLDDVMDKAAEEAFSLGFTLVIEDKITDGTAGKVADWSIQIKTNGSDPTGPSYIVQSKAPFNIVDGGVAENLILFKVPGLRLKSPAQWVEWIEDVIITINFDSAPKAQLNAKVYTSIDPTDPWYLMASTGSDKTPFSGKLSFDGDGTDVVPSGSGRMLGSSKKRTDRCKEKMRDKCKRDDEEYYEEGVYTIGFVLDIWDNRFDGRAGRITGWDIEVRTDEYDSYGPDYSWSSDVSWPLIDGERTSNTIYVRVPGLNRRDPYRWFGSIIGVTVRIYFSNVPLGDLTVELYDTLECNNDRRGYVLFDQPEYSGTFSGYFTIDDAATSRLGSSIVTAGRYYPTDYERCGKKCRNHCKDKCKRKRRCDEKKKRKKRTKKCGCRDYEDDY